MTPPKALAGDSGGSEGQSILGIDLVQRSAMDRQSRLSVGLIARLAVCPIKRIGLMGYSCAGEAVAKATSASTVNRWSRGITPCFDL
jgi:hypothetical protein